ncbi:endospore germination permease [Paenibacillus vulneris]|uniref:Endospore germination permease n=1 Tax=Paenibacillus vulneris TaxID=1133364 RepID=A0ABW3UQ93_9BACL
MIEKGKISAGQLGILTLLLVGATGILTVPSITAKHAERDMWMSPVWGSISGFLTIYIAFQLEKLYPNKSIIEYSEAILGRWLGKISGLFVLFFLLHSCGGVVREYGEFIIGAFLQRTPLPVVIWSLVITCSFGVRGGLEVLARCSQVFFPICVVIFLVVVVSLIPDLKPHHILPVLEFGLTPSLEGSIIPHSWFVQFFLISFLLPFLGKGNGKGLLWGNISVTSLMLIFVVTNLTCLFLFDDKLTSRLTYPVYTAIRFSNPAGFLSHLESLVMMFWIMAGFVQTSVWYYSLVLGCAQWLGLSDYRPIVFPMGMLIAMNAVWVAPNLSTLITFISTTEIFFKYTVLLVLPIILLSIALLRKRWLH